VNDFLDSDLLEEVEKKESKIRKILSDVTLKKVIIVALLLMFVIPLFDSDIYTDQANSFDYTLNNLNYMLNMPAVEMPLQNMVDLINYAITDHLDEDYYLIYFSTPFN